MCKVYSNWPGVGLWPYTPQKKAGRRPDPATSEARPITDAPAPSKAPYNTPALITAQYFWMNNLPTFYRIENNWVLSKWSAGHCCTFPKYQHKSFWCASSLWPLRSLVTHNTYLQRIYWYCWLLDEQAKWAI